MNKTLLLTPSDHETIGRLLVDGIISNGTVDELPYHGHVFVFSGKQKCEFETRSTGVEFLGQKETFVHTNITVEDFALEGVYDAEGEEVRTNLDPRSVCMDYEDDGYTVRARLKPWTNSPAVTIPVPDRKNSTKQRTYIRPSVTVGRRISA